MVILTPRQFLTSLDQTRYTVGVFLRNQKGNLELLQEVALRIRDINDPHKSLLTQVHTKPQLGEAPLNFR